MSKRISGRICLECKHCHMSAGCPGYSEYTPPHPASWFCIKLGVDFYDRVDEADRKGLIEDLQRAETCEHFQEEER